MGKKITGIVLFVLGVLAALGGFVNGSWANLRYENPITSATQIIVIAALIIVGIILVAKGQKSNKE